MQRCLSTGLVSMTLITILPFPSTLMAQEEVNGAAQIRSGVISSSETETGSSNVPGEVRDQFSNLREFRRANPGVPATLPQPPGMKAFTGLDAPESEAIKVLFSRMERYRGQLSSRDFEEFKEATQSTKRNYVTNELVNSCRRLLSLNGNYQDKNQISKQIADELTAIDQQEQEHVKTYFYEMLASVSAEGRQFLIEEKSKIHSRIATVIEDYYFTSTNNPDRLIDSKVRFCSKV